MGILTCLFIDHGRTVVDLTQAWEQLSELSGIALQRPVASRMPSLVVVADAAAARAGAGTNKPTESHASVRPFLET